MSEVEERRQKKAALLVQLEETHVAQIACKRAGVPRATYYRWRTEDLEFAKAADEATARGELLVNDLAESQLVSLIRDRNFAAINLWLKHHHPKYGMRVEISGTIAHELPELTPEELATIRIALELAKLPSIQRPNGNRKPNTSS